jgi:MSHA biogenesis protein MshL
MDREVILEAKILEVQLSDGFQTGIDWSVLGFKQGNSYGLEPSTDFEGTASNQAFTLNASGQSFTAAIKLLSAEGNVQVLSSPRVSTVNNQKAVIKVGDEEYFVTNLSNSTLAAGASANTTQNVNLTPFFSGIALDVTPQIDPAGNVILYIHPTVSKVVQQSKTITLQNGVISLPSAFSTIRESDSIIRARNNQVIVLGGLMQNNTNEALQGTPGLGRVPFLGALFRNSKQASKKTELVILLRPIVVGANTWFQQMDQEADRFHRLNRGFHVGDRPEVFGNLGEFKGCD